jgi:hypothetical protein
MLPSGKIARRVPTDSFVDRPLAERFQQTPKGFGLSRKLRIYFMTAFAGRDAADWRAANQIQTGIIVAKSRSMKFVFDCPFADSTAAAPFGGGENFGKRRLILQMASTNWPYCKLRSLTSSQVFRLC